jgi:hypothetical protein
MMNDVALNDPGGPHQELLLALYLYGAQEHFFLWS